MGDFNADYYKGRMEDFRRDLRWWLELAGKMEAIIADHPRGRIQTAGSAYLADDLKRLIEREDKALTHAEDRAERAELQRDELLKAIGKHADTRSYACADELLYATAQKIKDELEEGS